MNRWEPVLQAAYPTVIAVHAGESVSFAFGTPLVPAIAAQYAHAPGGPNGEQREFGKRLQTVYLAHPPEANQTGLSTMLTELIRGVLAGWEGPLPELTYVWNLGARCLRYWIGKVSQNSELRT